VANKGGPVKVLFVCTGNICRSPTAEGVFRDLIMREGLNDRVQVDSAGTHGFHVGEPPDRRSQESAEKRGIDLSQLRARRTKASDFAKFDYVLAMDFTNIDALRSLAPRTSGKKLQLLMAFAPGDEIREVPDPYYGNGDGFERVLNMIEEASAGLLSDIRKNHL
jgi:protein-tyrosine phosphatase